MHPSRLVLVLVIVSVPFHFQSAMVSGQEPGVKQRETESEMVEHPLQFAKTLNAIDRLRQTLVEATRRLSEIVPPTTANAPEIVEVGPAWGQTGTLLFDPDIERAMLIEAFPGTSGTGFPLQNVR